ncbi:hypothetical protein WCU72_17405, partial [Pectobacterium parmentieri]|uniref:hypothetical protein n=1 Tax=Pectobacterium parmentieri TaxID=1905730 RepID=UPI003018FC2B
DMPGKICPFCGKATLFGSSCTHCKAKVKEPVNGGKGGKGVMCPFCKTNTLFKQLNGSLKCTGCSRTFTK